MIRNFLIMIILCISSIHAMDKETVENSITSSLLDTEVKITQEEWERLPYYSRLYCSVKVVIMQEGDKFWLGKVVSKHNPHSLNVSVLGKNNVITKYPERSVRFTVDWPDFVKS